MKRRPSVLIVGAGLAGLCCARRLQQHEVKFQIVEASDDVGGRIRTDQRQGFLLDRGFQVFLTEYPEAQRVLDYDQLQLCSFTPGALVRFEGAFHELSDPWRDPRSVFSTLLAGPGSVADRLRIARLKMATNAGPIDYLLRKREESTLAELRRLRFSQEMIDGFFRPFFGGVFLNASLTSSSRAFEFLFRMFSSGDAAVPARGMAEIPKQIAARLPGRSIRLRRRVRRISAKGVTLDDGTLLNASAVVVATGPLEAARMVREITPVEMRGVTCVYFVVDRSPLEAPMLILNGEGKGPINNLAVISDIAPLYAPQGKALLSVTVLEQFLSPRRRLEKEVGLQLGEWFGGKVQSLRHLRTYRIPFALPDQSPENGGVVERAARVRRGLYRCGDYCDLASINGAMASGRRAAEAVLEDFG